MNGSAPRPGARPRSRLVFFSASLILFSLFTPRAPAQAQDLDEVSFSGGVTDQNGAVVRGATVTARLAGAKAGRVTETDAEGRYRLVEMPPGEYVLRAECAGFAAEERGPVTPAAGRAVRLDFRLRPAGVSAEQTVSGEADAPAVDATRTVAGGTVTREEVERLPVFTRSPAFA